MAAYHFTTLKIIDKKKFLEYAEQAKPLLEEYGGEYLAAGRSSGSLEGEAISNPMVLTKWANIGELKRFWNSPEYERLKMLRSGAVVVNSTIIES